MSRRSDNAGRGRKSPAAPREAYAKHLRALAGAMEALADKHAGWFDCEGYAALVRHAAELKAVARLLSAENLASEVATVIDRANEHLRYVRDLFEEGGDA